MKDIFVKYLFNHHYFVNQDAEKTENSPETRLALAKLFNIRIIEGADLLQPSMINLASDQFGVDVPNAFYTGFPKSVLKLSEEELLMDQLLHYYKTYGQDNFDEAGHSLFEETIERQAFNEDTPVKDFTVLTEADAVNKLHDYVDNLLSGSRPLSDEQFYLVSWFLPVYHYKPERITSKNTVIRLLIAFCDPYYAKFLMLSDVPKLADELNYQTRLIKNPKKLNLKNKYRKLLSAVIDELISEGKIDLQTCYEKKALWSGLLHHIHYKTADPKGIEFLNAMRGDENHSAFSEFEAVLTQNGPVTAADVLIKQKGSGALMRNLDYLLSRCASDDEIKTILQKIETKNTILLIQLLIHYSSSDVPLRTFKFVKYNMMTNHLETTAEAKRRKTRLAERDRKTAASVIREYLEDNLKCRLGKVYIEPNMKNIALPLQEGTSQGGFGTLSKGSRIPLPEGKKIRAFTYWELVNDIDLSVIGLDHSLCQHEFSWRTMAEQQSEAITFSGDQTSGYDGGSEFFDIDPVKFKIQNPDTQYLIFCNNIFSGESNFQNCTCRAGYMLRDINDSGEIFEPKTVKSAFRIDCASRFAYLFGLDLTTNDFVWLNIANNSVSRVAGMNSMAYLAQYFEMTKIINVYDFFRMMAAEIVDDPALADIAVTDEEIEVGKNTEIIRSYDSERIMALMN